MKTVVELTIKRNDNGTYSGRIKANFLPSQENVRNADSIKEITDRVSELFEEADEQGRMD